MVINAEEGIKEHDKHIAGYAIERGKGLIFVVNKWDTVKDKTIPEFEKEMKALFGKVGDQKRMNLRLEQNRKG